MLSCRPGLTPITREKKSGVKVSCAYAAIYTCTNSIILTPGLLFCSSLCITVAQQSGAFVEAKWTTAGNIAGLASDRQFPPQWDNGSGCGWWSGLVTLHTYLQSGDSIPLPPSRASFNECWSQADPGLEGSVSIFHKQYHDWSMKHRFSF